MPNASSRPAVPDLEALVEPVCAIARRAGAAILPYYRTDLDIDRKDDHSPVTEADHAADAVIVPALEALTPDIPVVSEERLSSHRSAGADADADTGANADGPFWLVDPLDGTREFINRRDEFTVNIALVAGARPVFGVLGIPVRDVVYAGHAANGASGVSGAASRQAGDRPAEPVAVRAAPAAGIVVAASRSHDKWDELDDFLDGENVARRIIAGSALKFALVAEGTADLYPRLGPTMEWDTAAGQAIVEAAGGSVRTLNGGPLIYGKAGWRNAGFVVRGRPAA
ncbi:MAG: 3'(2'),5'-bisphosphate nucleotidase CysQ [Rhodospirillaceae bacterium]|nr:3'(2'),5'-bisphosphate nucleotidase CysQ [Rhodospirillaceae bacterium]